MSKKPALSEALHKASGKKGPVVTVREDSSDGSRRSNLSSPPPPPSRRGKKAIAGHFDPAVARQLKQLALDNDATVQSLLTEALNDLFEKYGVQPIA